MGSNKRIQWNILPIQCNCETFTPLLSHLNAFHRKVDLCAVNFYISGPHLPVEGVKVTNLQHVIMLNRPNDQTFPKNIFLSVIGPIQLYLLSILPIICLSSILRVNNKPNNPGIQLVRGWQSAFLCQSYIKFFCQDAMTYRYRKSLWMYVFKTLLSP